VLDDGQAEAGAAGGPGPGRVDPVERSKIRSRSFSEIPVPWSVTDISTVSVLEPGTLRAAMATRVLTGL
jgi:hypothetical protein